MLTCDSCGKNCRYGSFESLPENCLCLESDKIAELTALYDEEENHKLAYHSTMVVSDGVDEQGYFTKTRLEELIDFARRCEYTNLGVAFCAGLSAEAKTLCDILRRNGFTVNAIACKTGGVPKETIGISSSQKVEKGKFEALCNPIAQAYFLDREKTQLNIILGLCVGHDTLFIKYSAAPVTCFATKDRVLANNAMGALYCAQEYYKKHFYK